MHWWGQRSCRGQLGCSQCYRAAAGALVQYNNESRMCCSYTQQILATLAPDWQLPVVAILAILHWDTGFRATTGPSMAAAAPWGQSGNCQSGSEWHHTLALVTLATAGNCHWGPRVAVTWLFITFLHKNEMIRWFPCGTWHHSGSFIVKMVWGCTAGFIFPFLSLLSKLFNLEHLFFRWFGKSKLQVPDTGTSQYWWILEHFWCTSIAWKYDIYVL